MNIDTQSDAQVLRYVANEFIGDHEVKERVLSIVDTLEQSLSSEIEREQVEQRLKYLDQSIYKLDGERVGTVDNFVPKEWYGKVTLDIMPEMAEYGMLDTKATVLTTDNVEHTFAEAD